VEEAAAAISWWTQGPVCGPTNVTLSAVTLAASVPLVTRTLVFAMDAQLRAQVAAALGPSDGQ